MTRCRALTPAHCLIIANPAFPPARWIATAGRGGMARVHSGEHGRGDRIHEHSDTQAGDEQDGVIQAAGPVVPMVGTMPIPVPKRMVSSGTAAFRHNQHQSDHPCSRPSIRGNTMGSKLVRGR
jgi:hypothetical protein